MYQLSFYHILAILAALPFSLDAATNRVHPNGTAINNSFKLDQLGPRVYSDSCYTIDGDPNIWKNYSIRGGTTYLFSYPLSQFLRARLFVDPRKLKIRIRAKVGSEADMSCPIIFVIRQHSQITAMELPYTFAKNGTIYTEAARTLCVPEPDEFNLKQRNITVRVATCSERPINFSFIVEIAETYLIPKNIDQNFQVLPTTPEVHAYRFGPKETSVKLIAESKDFKCMTVSIQPLECPIYYYNQDVRFNGLWQTMSGKAAMTVENSGRYEGGFTIVLVAHDDDTRCKVPSSLQEYDYSKSRTNPVPKRLTVLVSSDARLETHELFFVLVIPILLTFLVIFLSMGMFQWRHVWIRKEAKKMDITDSHAIRNVDFVRRPGTGEGVEVFLENSLNRNSGAYHSFDTAPSPHYSRPTSVQMDYVRRPIPMHNIPESPGASEDFQNTPLRISKVSFKAQVHLGDFAIGRPQVVQDRHGKRFCWALVTVAVFYTVPVYQLLFHYLRLLYKTGEYDFCYYNYLCSYRVGYLLDFNHFFSNIGYIIFGIAFIYIVRCREVNIKCPKNGKCRLNHLSRPVSTLQLQAVKAEKKPRCDWCFPVTETIEGFGIAPYYGVFYSLGLALVMEGMLSGAYHVCPNQTSFQFDTCFMYVISMLTILKVYQFRHPVFLDAHQTFGILAAIILASVAGLILEYGNSKSTGFTIFWILFIICQFVLLFFAAVYYYTLGYVYDDDGTILQTLSFVKRFKAVPNMGFKMDRLYFPILSFILCVAVVAYCIKENIAFATYLLYTFIANVLGSCFYYILLMKPLHGEFKNYTWIQPTLYFLASGMIGGFAVYYFVQTPAAWEKSAAESRALNNVPCLEAWFPFQPFYDVHDVWHFYSAAALFLAFMGLLTVDDDLVGVPRSRIPVF